MAGMAGTAETAGTEVGLGKLAFMSVVTIAFPRPHPNPCLTEFVRADGSALLSLGTVVIVRCFMLLFSSSKFLHLWTFKTPIFMTS
jgi:hypothetical protein